MTDLLIGLRSAVIVLYVAMLSSYVRGRLPDKAGDRIGAYGWIAVCNGVVLSSVTFMADLVGLLDIRDPIPEFLRALSMAFLLAGSILWAAARGVRRGATIKHVRIGVWVNLAVITACIVAAFALR